MSLAFPALLLPLLMLGGAQAAVAVLHPVEVANAATAVPASLAAGTTGVTTLGASGASATTAYATVPLAQVLALGGGGAAWNLRVDLVGHSGVGALNTHTLRLCDPPAACTDHVRIAGGSVLQSAGAPTLLGAGEADVTVQSVATKVSGGTTTLSTHLVLTPAIGAGVEVRLPFTLVVA